MFDSQHKNILLHHKVSPSFSGNANVDAVNATRRMRGSGNRWRCSAPYNRGVQRCHRWEGFAIPKKFYRDLTNTRYLNVFEQNGRIVVELGGQAAGAYTAHFMLGGMCGFERKVCGEACAEIWEQSIWYNSFAYEADPQCTSGIQ